MFIQMKASGHKAVSSPLTLILLCPIIALIFQKSLNAKVLPEFRQNPLTIKVLRWTEVFA